MTSGHIRFPWIAAVAGALVASGLLVGEGPASHTTAFGAGLSGAEVEVRPDSLLAAVTFDSVWSKIRNTHYDPGLRGVDWEAARSELRPRALAAETSEELRNVLRELLGRLGESHFVLIPGEAAPAFAGDAPAPAGAGDPGIAFRWIDGELLVTRVRESGALAGVELGWVLEEVAGEPVDSLAASIRRAAPRGEEERQLALWLPVGVQARAAGPEGTSVPLRFRDETGASRPLEVPRAEPSGAEVRFGNLPPIRMETTHRIDTLDGGLRVGVLRFTAWFPAALPEITRAVDEMRDVDGLVLDLRGNPGGIGGLVIGVGGHFLDERVDLGQMRTRETTLRFVVNPQRVGPDGERVVPYGGPFAILVDPLTASTSEIFAAGMQALGRARVFGEATAGQALPALVVELPNGDRLMHAIADFTAPDGSRLEGVGVRPDVLAPPTREALLAGADRALEEAVGWIRAQAGP